MPFDTIKNAWNAPCSSASEQVVLVALATFANDNLTCWPSIPTLAKRTKLSERGVRYQLEALKKSGLVKIEYGGGKHRPNQYRLILPNPAPHSGNGIPGKGFTETDCPNPAPYSSNPAPVAYQLPRTAKEQPRGKAPIKTVHEMDKQIRSISEEIGRIKDFGTEEEKKGIPALSRRRRELREEMWKK